MEKKTMDRQTDAIKHLSDCLDRMINEYNEKNKKNRNLSVEKRELAELRRRLANMASLIID